MGEPPKKKKRIDPIIQKMRDDRKKRRIAKEIRIMERSSLKLKPLEEMDILPKFRREIPQRQRTLAPLSVEELDYRTDLKKRWASYKTEQHVLEINMLARMIDSQNKALEALREESEVLYQQAVQVDPHLIPFKMSGPVETPPIFNYDSPDGDYVDTTKKWK